MKKLILPLFAIIAFTSCKKHKETTVLFSNENIQSIAKYASTEDAFEGQSSFKITPNDEYGPTWRFTENQLNLNNAKEVTISFRARNVTPQDSLIFVFSANSSSGKSVFYHGLPITNPDIEKNKWRLHMGTFDVSAEQPADTQYSIYIWNNKRQTVFVDDIEFTTK